MAEAAYYSPTTLKDLLYAISAMLRYEAGTFTNESLNKISKFAHKVEALCREAQFYFQSRRYTRRGSPVFPTGNTFSIAPPDSQKKALIEKIIESEIPNLIELSSAIVKKCSSIKYERLSKQLQEGVNPEINQDQKILVGYIQHFSFNNQLIQILEKIDTAFVNAKDGFDFKSCIGHIRTFVSDLVFDVAEEVEKKTQKTSIPLEKSVAKIRNFFKERNFFSKQEDQFFEGLYAFLSDEGAHSLASEVESARIAKNMTIEFGLYMLKKMEKFITDKSLPNKM